jgi:hypothetical protein
MYFIGRSKMDERMQIAGLALTQSLVIATGSSVRMTAGTGRAKPGIVDVADHRRSDETSDFSGDFEWGFIKRSFIAGWPSGHTANAFAAAATLAEIYSDNTFVKVSAYSYAVLVGLGTSVCVHWSSEVFAGALIGYAVGKTVGMSFNKLLSDNDESNNISFFVTPNSITITFSF